MNTVFDTMKEKMNKTIGALEKEYAGMRAGRASAAILDKIQVDYYGVPTPIQQMAAISVSEGRILIIQPWDVSTINPISKAIQASDVGITPANDGKCIRLVFPPLTEERRKELTKQTSKLGEGSKVALRNIRRDANDKCKEMKKASEMTEDEQKQSEKEVQDLTDKYIKIVDDITAKKQKEIMEI